MKATKWREMSEDELKDKGKELAEELFNLRFQLSMGVAKNPSRVRPGPARSRPDPDDPPRAHPGEGVRRPQWARGRPGKAWW